MSDSQEPPPPYADTSERVTLEKRPSTPLQDDRPAAKARREMTSFGSSTAVSQSQTGDGSQGSQSGPTYDPTQVSMPQVPRVLHDLVSTSNTARIRLYEEHTAGVKALEAYTAANTHLSYVRREEHYMAKVQDYSMHIRREWWRCYDRNVQLEAELAKHGIPSPSPYLEPYNRYAPPEDPPTAELWTTKWEKMFAGDQYTKWKDAGLLDPDVVAWVESQTAEEHKKPAVPPSSSLELTSKYPRDVPNTSTVRFYPQRAAKIADMLKRCTASQCSASQQSDTDGMMDSQDGVFTVPEELPNWFEEELANMKGEGEEEAVEMRGSLAQAIQDFLSESQEKTLCTK